MVEIEIIVEMEDGKEHKMVSKSGFMTMLLARLPRNMRKLVQEVEKDGKKVVKQEVLFKGDWNFMVLHKFTKGLDERGIEWKWEMVKA